MYKRQAVGAEAAESTFLFTPSATAIDSITAGSNEFRMCFTDPAQGAKSAEYIGEHGLATKVAVLYDSMADYNSGVHDSFVEAAEENGLEIAQFMCVGGGTKNKEWLQIIADVTGREIKTAEVTIGASYGDAMIAAVGTGHFQSYQELENYIEVDKIIKPNIKNYEKYQSLKKIYFDLYDVTKKYMHQL